MQQQTGSEQPRDAALAGLETIQALQRAGMKWWALAAELGVSTETLWRLRQGARPLKPDEIEILEMLARRFGITPEVQA